MKMIKSSISLAIATLVLSGCASFSIAHECQLGEPYGPNCIGVTTAHDQASKSKAHPDSETVYGRANQNKDEGLFSTVTGWFSGDSKESREGANVFDNSEELRAVPILNGGRAPEAMKGLGQPGGAPVYTPPTPRRVWIAPWTDQNGVIHAGEWVYFETPGSWNIGTLKKDGAIGGTQFGPTVARPQATVQPEVQPSNTGPTAPVVEDAPPPPPQE